VSIVNIELPPKLVPIFEGEARYRAAYGGRGGAKSRAFAMMTAVWGYKFGKSGRTGQILCLRQYMNSLSESSFAEIKSAIQAVPFLNNYYDCGDHYIRSKDGRINYSFAGLTRNIDSIKSKARIILAFIDEAETVSEEAYMKLLPSIREENSECWVIWNPQSKDSATHKRFRENTPDSCKITAINWQDNPWMPEVLTNQRLEDLELRPDTYGHVWNGDFLEFPEGSFWLREINKAQADGRIGKLPVVEAHPCMTFWDIGASDGCAIFVVQQIGLEFRLIDFYEAWGESYNHAIKWIKSLDLVFEDMYLPHDADHKRQGQVANKSPRQMLKELMPSSNWRIVPRIQDLLWGIQQTSDMFPYIWIDEVKCAKGLDHLKAYRRKWSNSEQRWSHIPDKSEGHSEAADALRQMAQAFAAGDLGKTKKKHRGSLKRGIKGIA
jgi:phage terminase large subunit